MNRSTCDVCFCDSIVTDLETVAAADPFSGCPKYPSRAARMEYLPGTRSLKRKWPDASVRTVVWGEADNVPGANPSVLSWLAIRLSIKPGGGALMLKLRV